VARRLFLIIVLSLLLTEAAPAQTYHFEAQTGQMFGTHVASAVPGYSGTGYVTGFTASSGPPHYFQLQVDVPDGLYEMWVGYRSEFGHKGYDYYVDGVAGSAMFDHSTANYFPQIGHNRPSHDSSRASLV